MTEYLRCEPLDVLEIDGESLVLLPDGVMVRLSPIATAVFRLTEAPSTVESIATVLEESFGVPEAVPTLDATRLLIADLALAGLVHPAREGAT